MKSSQLTIKPFLFIIIACLVLLLNLETTFTSSTDKTLQTNDISSRINKILHSERLVQNTNDSISSNETSVVNSTIPTSNNQTIQSSTNCLTFPCWNGNCVENESCSCFYGWVGTYCNSTLTCYGKSYNNPTVCSGFGKCNSPNNCLCNEGYSGYTCKYYYCNSTLYSNTSYVCNGRGSCLQPDKCQCKNGYNGTFCEFEQQRPIAMLSYTLTEFHKCQPIVINGEMSTPSYGNPFIYIWTIQHKTKTSYVKQYSTPFLNLTTTEVTVYGSFDLTLTVKDAITGVLSIPKTITVVNLGFPPPAIEIVGKNNRTLATTDVPTIFRKQITNLDYSCVAKQEYNFTISWKQIYGPFVDFTTDTYSNLQINRLYSYGNQKYVFRVGTPAFDGSFYFYDDLEITTYSPELQLRVIQYLVSATTAHIEVEYYDPDMLNTQSSTWTWSCDPACSTTLQTALNSYGKTQSTSFDLTKDIVLTSSSFILTLMVVKGSRTATSSIEMVLSDKPVISVIDTVPKRTTITTDEAFVYQIYSQSMLDTISSRKWSLNGVELSDQSSTPSTSDFVIFPAYSLTDGTDNMLAVTIADSSGRLATTSYSFKVAKNPTLCSCQIQQSTGIFMETKFSYVCDSSCLKNQTLDIVYGFLEERTFTKIPLSVLGETYSAVLPPPYAGNELSLFLDVVNTKTMAKIGITSKVTILPMSFEKNILEKVSFWTDLYSNSEGNWNLNLYTASAIVRSISANMNNPNRTTCMNGVVSEGVCTCIEGYYGSDCSMKIADFKELQDNLVSLMSDLKTALIMHPDPNIYHLHLILVAIDSMLRDYTSVATSVVSNTISLLDKTLTRMTETQEIIPSKNVQLLIHYSLESMFKYFEWRSFRGEEDNMISAVALAKKSSRFLMRNKIIGTDPSQFISTTFRLVSAKVPRLQYKGIKIDLGEDSSVSFIGDVFPKAFSKSNIVYSVLTTKDIFKIADRMTITESGFIITPYVISPFSISLDFGEDNINNNMVDYSTIVYTFPLRNISDSFNYSKTYCAYYDQALKVVFGCSVKAYTGTSISCTCNKLGNVILIGQMKATTTYSFDWTLLGVVAITIVGAILLVCCCIIVIILIVIAVYCRKRYRVEDEKSQKIKVAETRYARSMMNIPLANGQSTYSMAAAANY
ncbi:predicted protein [Naegleria gruberi]|uniref:Predicted protein n=1 Tax=Naegleria gruberi TaxID=5762 RepID=D2UZF1_NAEGR|nr:uncharacterized protein NAEGRDRAFT_61914 [Naegleria gruberi]EFC50136.1 predicted protein [Naegleria gruberi]|eukprot:XP_002682880.1 predicted protein [Naegleria gruberi strain NEG-M]